MVPNDRFSTRMLSPLVVLFWTTQSMAAMIWLTSAAPMAVGHLDRDDPGVGGHAEEVGRVPGVAVGHRGRALQAVDLAGRHQGGEAVDDLERAADLAADLLHLAGRGHDGPGPGLDDHR